jgi:hypothetical protein
MAFSLFWGSWALADVTFLPVEAPKRLTIELWIVFAYQKLHSLIKTLHTGEEVPPIS